MTDKRIYLVKAQTLTKANGAKVMYTAQRFYSVSEELADAWIAASVAKPATLDNKIAEEKKEPLPRSVPRFETVGHDEPESDGEE